ncbi:MAG TPA: helix-turn-helix domain-containing protein [Candidatus Hydrogenedentes bacterium]|nr:helix-turn-helix domain-containing protein [Candidatus Hydrogenedentota bacterium]
MGRVPDTDNNLRQLKHLTDQHLEMIRRAVAGQRVGKIAAEMGVHRTTVSRVLNSRLGRECRARLHGEMDRMVAKAGAVLPFARIVPGIMRK